MSVQAALLFFTSKTNGGTNGTLVTEMLGGPQAETVMEEPKMRISGNMTVGMSNMNANRINQSVHRGNNLNIGGNNSPRRKLEENNMKKQRTILSLCLAVVVIFCTACAKGQEDTMPDDIKEKLYGETTSAQSSKESASKPAPPKVDSPAWDFGYVVLRMPKLM